MPISVTCDCGKALRAPDQLANKRTKCPACGGPILVPGLSGTGPKNGSSVPSKTSPERPAAEAAPSIRFSCECGKTLLVKATAAGKMIRCPECAESVRVPAPPKDDDYEEADYEEAEAETRVATGRKRQQDEEEEVAPRKRGIKAEAPVSRKRPVRDEDEEEEAPRGRTRSRDRDDEDEDEDEEEDERPRPIKKGKGKKKAAAGMPVWPFIAGGGGVAVLGLGILAYFIFFTSGNNNGNNAPRGSPSGPGGLVKSNEIPGVAFVPANAAGFASVRVADLMAANGTKAILAAMPPGAQTNLDFAKDYGITNAEIDRVTLVFQEKGPQKQAEPAWAVVTTSRPYDKAKILQEMKNPSAVAFEGKSYYPRPQPPGIPAGLAPPTAVYFVDANTFVNGPETGVKAAITAAASPVKSGPLAEAIARANGNDHFIGCYPISASLVASFRNDWSRNPQLKGLIPLLDAQMATATVNAVSDVEFKVSLTYADETKSKQASDAGVKGLKLLGSVITSAKLGIPPQQPNSREILAMMDQAENTLSTLVPELSGKNVSLTLRQSAASFGPAFQMANSLNQGIPKNPNGGFNPKGGVNPKGGINPNGGFNPKGKLPNDNRKK